ncbi:aminopeptidase [Conexibacter stalactiti]|uniref:Aminopeptidase n=1 Tax=Conexibacter stalactiti TaxID=1940611 RepID=A0ABU4HZS7_9ACTN|nr:aminopeptidase [Conexibacter stalactiti]MDW5598424.1 aminopeptidase [Conexibacter stalactiti]MEC5039066.1 aminopeptidase [Conexibacter stalactiti]
MNELADLIPTARRVVDELLALQPEERVALITDAGTPPQLTGALAGCVSAAGGEYVVLEMPTRGLLRNNELPAMIERALEEADCLLGLTRTSGAPTYAATTKRLLDAGSLRAISMVMRPLEIFTGGGALADYAELRAEGERLGDIWRRGRTMRITTPAGTDLVAEVSGEDVVIECGYADRPGMEAAFSDGEVSSRPHEGTARGTLVVDGPVAHVGTAAEPLRFTVENGVVTGFEGGGPQGRAMRHILDTVPHVTNIAEFGIGLNGACRRNGLFEEEKKARGNVHVALGDNIFYGGTVASPMHIDMVLYNPTVELDGITLVRDGVVELEPAEAARA